MSEIDVVLADRRTHGQSGAHCVVALPRVRLDRAEVSDDSIADEASNLATMLVDSIAHALIIAIDHTQQRLWIQPLAHGAEPYEIHKHRGRHLALSDKPGVGLYSIGDKPLDHACRREPGACTLKLLKRGFGRCQLRLEGFSSSPLVIERDCENREKDEPVAVSTTSIMDGP